MVQQHDIHTRLLRAEDDLLLALSSDSLDGFQHSWSKLSDDIAKAVQEEQLSEATQTLAHVIATRVHTIATGFAELITKDEELTASFLRGVEDILGKEPHSDGETCVARSGLPPYIPLAHTWLLDNLLCPYPSISVRNSLAEKTGSTRKAIDAWFIDARKRIGWNRLRRLRFSGKKDDIVRAASTFFCENKGDAILASEFASIEQAANELYAEKLRPSTLGSQLAEELDIASKWKSESTLSSNQNTIYPSPKSRSCSLPTSPIIPPPQTVSASNAPSLKRAREEAITVQRPSKRPRLPSRLPSPPSSRATPESQPSPYHQSSHESLSDSVSSPLQSNGQQVPSRDTRCLRSPPREVVGALNIFSESGSEGISPLQASSALVPPGISDSDKRPAPTQIEQSPVEPIYLTNHHRRCASEIGLQFPSTLRNKWPRLHSASDSSLVSSGKVPEWSFDPEIIHSGPDFDFLDDSTTYDVATFDFSTYSPQDLIQPKDSLLMRDGGKAFPSTGAAPDPFIVSPSVDPLHTIGLPNDGFLDLLDILPPDSCLPETGLPISSTLTLPNEAVPGLSLGFGPVILDINGTFDWSTPNDVQNMFGSLIHSPHEREKELTGFSTREKAKKLKLLADLKEAQQRLEAEIAAM